MKKITFLLAMMLVTFTACHNEDFEEISLESKREKISYEVTPEEAVSRLGMFLSNNGTRASLNDVTIKTLMKSDFVPATRSSDAEDAPAIYLIDIPDGGCAVMGADKRLEPVYAIMDETKLSAEDLTTSATRSESDDDEDIQTYITGLINDAIEADLESLVVPKDSLPFTPIPSKLDSLWTITRVYSQVEPLLKTKWHQNAPFNDNYPYHEPNVKEVAGCGVIATAQLVYYNRHPSSVTGVNFNWNLISQYEYPANPSNAVNAAVANFVLTLAYAVGADWSEQEEDPATSTTDAGIRNFFRLNGYPNAHFYSYTLSGVTAMLDNDKPVMICGKQSNKTKGHCWLIDGSNVYTVEHWTRRYTYVDDFTWDYTDTVSETNHNLLHCNYGWGGLCDGYYTSGIFDTRNALSQNNIVPSISDISGTGGRIYDTNLRIMQY